MSEAKCVEVTVSRGGSGDIQIVDYGKWKSGWHISFTKKFAIPEDWDADKVDEFLVEQEAGLLAIIDPLDQGQIDIRLANKNW